MNIYLAGSTSALTLSDTWSKAIQAAGHTALWAGSHDSRTFQRGWEELKRAHHVVVLVGDGYPATPMERLELATAWCLAQREDPSLRALSWVRAGQTPHAGPWSIHPDRAATEPAAYLAALPEVDQALAPRVERTGGLDTWVADDLSASLGEDHPAAVLAKIACTPLMGFSSPVGVLQPLLSRLEGQRAVDADMVVCAVALAQAWRSSMRSESVGPLLKVWAPRAAAAGVEDPALWSLHGGALAELGQWDEAILWLERSLAKWSALRGKMVVEAQFVENSLVNALIGAGRFEEAARLTDEKAALVGSFSGGGGEDFGVLRAKAMVLRAHAGDVALITPALDLAASFRVPMNRGFIQKLATKAQLAHPVPADLQAMISRGQREEWGSLLVLELQGALALAEAGEGEDLGALRRLATVAQQLKKVLCDHPYTKAALALLKRFPHVKPLPKAKAPTLKQITDHPAMELLFHRADPAAIPAGANKAAGDPDLPPDMAWPVAAAGPAVFLLQLRLSEVPSFPGREQLPAKGMLWFFLGETARGKPVDLLRFGAEDTALVRTSPPSTPACSWSEPSAWSPCSVTFAPLTLRSATRWRLTRVMAGMTQEQLDKLEDSDKLDPWESDIPVEGRSWLGGVPCVSQAHDPFEAVAEDGVFLAQIGYSEETGWMNGDGGQHCWFAQRAPLPNGVVEGAGVVEDCS